MIILRAWWDLLHLTSSIISTHPFNVRYSMLLHFDDQSRQHTTSTTAMEKAFIILYVIDRISKSTVSKTKIVTT